MNYEEWKKEHFERIYKEKEDKRKCVLVEETFKKFPKEEKKMNHKEFRKLPYLEIEVKKVKGRNGRVEINMNPRGAGK